jgi:hypothetical protein
MTAKVLTTRILIVLGLALLAAGLVLGLLPKTAPGAYGPVSCGSAFHGSSAARVDDYQATLSGGPAEVGLSPLGSTSSTCAAARSGAKTAPVVLLVLGAGLLVGGVVVAASKERLPVASTS